MAESIDLGTLGKVRVGVQIAEFAGDIDPDNPPEPEAVRAVVPQWFEDGALVTDPARHAELEAEYAAKQQEDSNGPDDRLP